MRPVPLKRNSNTDPSTKVMDSNTALASGPNDSTGDKIDEQSMKAKFSRNAPLWPVFNGIPRFALYGLKVRHWRNPKNIRGINAVFESYNGISVMDSVGAA